MSEPISKVFRFCPRCGLAAETTGVNPFRCSGCEFTHFFSPCTAVAGIVADEQGRVLFLRRQRDPGKGKLGLPGGFVDAGESAEDALRREALEEINLHVRSVEFLATFPNSYTHQGVILPVTDVFFACVVETFETIAGEKTEVASWHFCHPGPAVLNDMAFDSNRRAVELYLRSQDRP
jgi:ADP-ribose pyrophosphatase